MKLENKVAVITGGGRGIGKAIVLRFAREGAKVVIASRTKNEIDRCVQEIVAPGGFAVGITTDISKEDSIQRLFQSVEKWFGGTDILVNNAGIQGPIGPCELVDVQDWVKNIQVNLIGTFHCMKTVLPGMKARKRGKIINLSGGGATSPRPRFSAYAAAKAAIVRLTETIAEEVQEFGIDVNALAPGAVNTRMQQDIVEAGELAGEKEWQQARERIANQAGTPEAAAELALFLASEKSNGISGKLISAVYDPWQEEPFLVRLQQDKDFATLRRIDDKYFEKRT